MGTRGHSQVSGVACREVLALVEAEGKLLLY